MAIEISPGGPRFSPCKSIFIKQPGLPDTKWKHIGATAESIIVDERAEYPPDFFLPRDLSISATIPSTRKNRRAFRMLIREVTREKPFQVLYGKMGFWRRLVVWTRITWAKLWHRQITIVGDGRVLLCRDINLIL